MSLQIRPTAVVKSESSNPIRKEEAESEPQPSANRAKTKLSISLSSALSIAVVLVITVVMIMRFLMTRACEETDDAYVTGHPHQISARIDNVVESVLVDDNDHVEQGQLLIKLDRHDYALEVARAKAKLDMAIREATSSKTEISYAHSSADAERSQAAGSIDASYAAIAHQRSNLSDAIDQVSVAKSELAEAEAKLTRAQLDCKRYTILEERGVVSTQQKEHAVSDFEVCKSARDALEKAVQQSITRCEVIKSAVAEARARLKESFGQDEKARSLKLLTQVKEDRYTITQAAVAEAESEFDSARLKLAYCNIYAPVSGRVGKRTVEVGHRIEPGQQLMHIVEDYVWVVANFKETQVRRMSAGQIATIKIDSLPDKELTGVVDSFSPGSGASFALLPPDNAIGNFTKIVQRVPVKIRLDRTSLDALKACLPVGLSATVKVDTEHRVTESQLLQLREMDSPQKKIWDGDGKGF